MTRSRVWLSLLGIVIVAVSAAYLATPQGPSRIPVGFIKSLVFRLGLDLQGGSQLIYEADLSSIRDGEKTEAINGVRDVIERRINAFGVSEPVIQVQGDKRLLVELPGVTDINEAVAEIGKTPFLEFKETTDDPNILAAAAKNPDQAASGFVPTGLTGAQFERADIDFGQTGQPTILLSFNNEGKKLFGEITARNVGKQVAIFLDGQVLSAPVVQQKITSGQATITGSFTVDEAKELKKNLNAGALPVPINLISQANIGASLGNESVQFSLLAGLIGLLGVAIFMLLYYRLMGVVAIVALTIYTAVIIVIFKLFTVTLTLPGLAGLYLSIGIAVDANVLIFERIKEALRERLPAGSAVEEGFRMAWPSIRDSNLSSIISVVIMYIFTTSLVRGFALTLGIGVVVSLFSAITVSRTLLRWFIGFKWLRGRWLWGLSKKDLLPEQEDSEQQIKKAGAQT